MADSQDIEAKLAAYVDGELPADQRVEIEKYLSANPQQRRLIADLMRQRDVLRDLPKAVTPGDVSETLNSQLERSVLLDRPEVNFGAESLRSWRSVAAVAATILLVSALALTIYSLLPSPTRKPPDLATIQTIPATRPGADEVFSATSAAAPMPSEQEMRARAALTRSEAPVSDATTRPMEMNSVGGGMGVPMTIENSASVDRGPLNEPSVVPRMELSKVAALRVEKIDVLTHDVAAARRQLASTLTAIGGKVTLPTTSVADSGEFVGTTLSVEVPPQDMDRAVAVARSFQSALPASPRMADAIAPLPTMQPAAEINPVVDNSQLQAVSTAQQQAFEPNAPATQPAETVTVILSMLRESQPTTAPATQPATLPSSNPSTEPTTQP